MAFYYYIFHCAEQIHNKWKLSVTYLESEAHFISYLRCPLVDSDWCEYHMSHSLCKLFKKMLLMRQSGKIAVTCSESGY